MSLIVYVHSLHTACIHSFFYFLGRHRLLPSCPTRRSSDLVVSDGMTGSRHHSNKELVGQGVANVVTPLFGGIPATGDRKSTRLNSSHVANSYAVFCLKKKS